MDDTTRPANDTSRKPYIAPKIEQVELRPEEAVLGACKTSKISGPTQARCQAPTACSSLTS